MPGSQDDHGMRAHRILNGIAILVPVGFVVCFFFVPMGWLFLVSLSERIPARASGSPERCNNTRAIGWTGSTLRPVSGRPSGCR